MGEGLAAGSSDAVAVESVVERAQPVRNQALPAPVHARATTAMTASSPVRRLRGPGLEDCKDLLDREDSQV